MSHYKSWSGLHKQLAAFLHPDLQGRITYFLTRYHQVHNAYGRASVRLDDRELVSFTWWNGYLQERDVQDAFDYENSALVEKWNRDGTFCDMQFLEAATEYLQMQPADALISENLLHRMFALLDKRVGKRSLEKLYSQVQAYPQWLRQFYELRMEHPNEIV